MITAVVLFVAGLGAFSLLQAPSETQRPVQAPRQPLIPTQDADTYADTVQSMAIEVQGVKNEFSDVEETLRRQQVALEELSEAISHGDETAKDDYASLMTAVEELIGERVEEVKSNLPAAVPVITRQTTPAKPAEPLWILPREESVFERASELPAEDDDTQQWFGQLDELIDRTTRGFEPIEGAAQSSGDEFSTSRTEDDTTPIYTIPKNATAFAAKAATALIGRVPRSGQVSDPYRFKVVTGPDLLATTGIMLPGVVAGMVWSGTAVGDWGLGCVRGRLDSVTFTFSDSRIVTHDQTGNRGIGWISDAFGNPCIEGTRVSNAGATLSARAIGAGLESGARAYAAGQTDQLLSNGVVVNRIDDAGALAALDSIGEGARELNRFLDQRLRAIFDAVYAPNGTEVLIHLETAIPIDHVPNQRRVSYE
ncbi:MAG: TIGR03752 family integrating conjugative element protein [Pseudomonadota bacterium]